MRKRSVLIGVVAAVGSLVGMGLPASAADDPSTNIVGGGDATEEYSFMVSLQSGGSHSCGASLIKADWAVTAAHCVEGQQPGDLNVRVASNDHTTGGEEAGVADIKMHDTADLAVIQLDKQVQAQPIKIAAESGPDGTESRIMGWGQTCPESGCGDAPQMLQELDTTIVPDADCTGIEGESEICTSNPNGDSGACYGDSGGPQVKGSKGSWELIGATSRTGNGDPTCATGPSIYVDVPAHSDWINQNTGG